MKSRLTLLSLSLSLSPEAVELATVVQERAGGTGGRGPVAAPDLTKLLPAAEVRLQCSGIDLRREVRDDAASIAEVGHQCTSGVTSTRISSIGPLGPTTRSTTPPGAIRA